jgi:hypothetical protein
MSGAYSTRGLLFQYYQNPTHCVGLVQSRHRHDIAEKCRVGVAQQSFTHSHHHRQEQLQNGQFVGNTKLVILFQWQLKVVAPIVS